MFLDEAEDLLARLVGPTPLDVFLDEILGRRFLHVPASQGAHRAAILGPDPKAVILANYARLSPHIGHHALAPSSPPPTIEALASAKAFAAKIDEFHARGYTVRVPSVRSLSSELDLTLRAIEAIFHQPATAEAFWSRGDTRAPVHHDDYDLFVVQLVGRKKWRIATGPSDLTNAWKTIPDGPKTLEAHVEVVVEPGDLLYLPRGTTHAVDALAESVHVSIGCTALTLREALIACVDQLSDLARPMRETVGARLGGQVHRNRFGPLPDLVHTAARHVADACAREDFVAASLQRRSSRVIGDMDRLTAASAERAPLELSSRVRRSRLALSHLSASDVSVDIAYPGGHHYVHRGAEKAVEFLAGAREFAVADLPCDLSDDVRVALVQELVDSGVLEIVE
jgi:hypothetical protein